MCSGAVGSRSSPCVLIAVGVADVHQLADGHRSTSRRPGSSSASTCRTRSETTGALYQAIARAQSYADLADSTDLMNQVISDLDLTITPERARRRDRCRGRPGHHADRRHGHDDDPEQAQSIAAGPLPALHRVPLRPGEPQRLEQHRDLARITDSASYNGSPVSPRTTAELRGRRADRPAARHRRAPSPGTPSTARSARRSTSRRSPTSRSSRASGTTARSRRTRCSPTSGRSRHAPRRSGCCAPTCSSSTSITSRAAWSSAARCRARARPWPRPTWPSRSPRPAAAPSSSTATCAAREWPASSASTAAVGLTTVLVGNTDVKDAIQVHEDSGLHFLASGAKPPNPTEILQSRVTHDLIRELCDVLRHGHHRRPAAAAGGRRGGAVDDRRRRHPGGPARQDQS